jgi:hypothetical protein
MEMSGGNYLSNWSVLATVTMLWDEVIFKLRDLCQGNTRAGNMPGGNRS